MMGEGSEVGLLSSVEHAIRSFKKNEKALLRVSATHGYGSQGNAEFNIPPNADLEYEVKLKTFEKVGLMNVGRPQFAQYRVIFCFPQNSIAYIEYPL